MTEVIVKDRLDPVLKKLLDDLPLEDPDRKKVIVWCSWCEGRHEIYMNEETRVNFGEWYGPPMGVTSIPIFAKVEGYATVLVGIVPEMFSLTHIDPGDLLEVRLTISDC